MRKLLCIALALGLQISFAKNLVRDYQRIFLPVYTSEGDLRIAIRVFKMNELPSFLVVNPQSLETQVLPITDLKMRATSLSKNKPGYLSYRKVANTRYFQLLNQSTAPPYLLENQGITHANNAGNANVLTIDLCPSIKPFESAFFNNLIQLSDKANSPFPVLISISGLWLINHPEEFQWFLAKEKEKKLAITWANHSFTHSYYKDSTLLRKFSTLTDN